MSDGIKKNFKKAIWWSGVFAVGIVFGTSLQFIRTWMEPSEYSLVNSSVLGNVASAQGTSGYCYTSYGQPPVDIDPNNRSTTSPWCLAGFEDKGKIGNWGACSTGIGQGNYAFFRPENGICLNWRTGSTVYTIDLGEAHKCCR